MSKRAPEIILSEEEKKELQSWVRAQKTEKRYLLRANIVLCAAESLENKQIAQELHVNEMTVGKWRSRFYEQRIDGLKDRPRPGKPLTYDTNARAKIIEVACKPPSNTRRWSVRDLAKALNGVGVQISKSQLNHMLNELDLKPHQFRSWLRSKDPDFERKEAEIVGLYMDPPENSFVISVDEKTRIQAREPVNTTILMSPGHPERYDPTYKRHGYTSLLAALFVHKGEVYGKAVQKHRSAEFISFLDEIDNITDPTKDIHVIVDNFSAHKSQLVKEWLERHPRFHFHYTPTHASWLNQIELWFSILGRKLLNHIEARSIDELVGKLMNFIAYYNETAHPFAWTYKGKVLTI
jgi:transposase